MAAFVEMNELAIMNTSIEKNIHKHTWQYQGSKKWHCIDYITMRQAQQKLCCAVTVLHSAECWIGHKLLRAQLRVQVSAKVYSKNTLQMRYVVFMADMV